MPNERPTAIAYFLSGRALAQAGDSDKALVSFREGARIVRERHLGVPEQLVSPFLATLFAAARADKADPPHGAQKAHSVQK